MNRSYSKYIFLKRVPRKLIQIPFNPFGGKFKNVRYYIFAAPNVYASAIDDTLIPIMHVKPYKANRVLAHVARIKLIDGRIIRC